MRKNDCESRKVGRDPLWELDKAKLECLMESSAETSTGNGNSISLASMATAPMPTIAGGSMLGSPCARCRFLRRKCLPTCVLAPYFPADQPQKFVNVHRVFGARNVSKILNDLLPSQREDAVTSLFYEAQMRLTDPVYGCVGIIVVLEDQLQNLKFGLSCAWAELSRLESATTAFRDRRQAIEIGMEELFFPDWLQQQQRMMMMMSSRVNDSGHTTATINASSLTRMGSFGEQSGMPSAGGDDHWLPRGVEG